jgi:hypothetical protein
MHRRASVGGEPESNESFEIQHPDGLGPPQDPLSQREGLVSSGAHDRSSKFDADASSEDALEFSVKSHETEFQKERFPFKFALANEHTEGDSDIANSALRPFANAVDYVYGESLHGRFSCLAFCKRRFLEFLCPKKLEGL